MVTTTFTISRLTLLLSFSYSLSAYVFVCPQALAALLAEEDQQQERERAAKAQLFYCEICMDSEASIHGAISLDCEHRFCEGKLTVWDY